MQFPGEIHGLHRNILPVVRERHWMGKGGNIDRLTACGGDCCVDAGDCAFRETFYVIWGIRMGCLG